MIRDPYQVLGISPGAAPDETGTLRTEKRMRNKSKMTKDTIPQDFTLSLALVDALPVLFFGGSMILIGLLFGSPLFLIGAALCFWAGAAKVVWKIIVVTKKKNVWWMFLQMRIVMPIGFLLMLLAVILNRNAIDLSAVFAAVISLPSVLFFAAGVIGMALMGVFAAKLDSADVRSNWIEQLTNGVSQAAIFIGILLLL